ncbi:MAG: PAS domain S-box protein [Opitutus sp.]|nr:PAS domain S-box protein [Opitutus sp.]
MIVAEDGGEYRALDEALSSTGVPRIRVTTPATALSHASQSVLALAIVTTGRDPAARLDLAWHLRQTPGLETLPLVIVGPAAVAEQVVQMSNLLRPVDFVPTPCDPRLVALKVDSALLLYRANLGPTGERELARQRERFRLLMDMASDYAIFFLDPGGRVVEWTTSAQHVLGFTPEEMLGQHADIIFTPEDRAAKVPETEIEHARLHGQAIDERWHLRSDGRRFYASGRLVALLNEANDVVGFAKVLRDTTEAKQTELRLRDSLERFEMLADNMSQLAWTANGAGERTWVNQRWLDYTGFAREEALGEGFRRTYHPDQLAHFDELVAAAAASGEGWEETFLIRGRGGSYRWFLSQVVPVKDEGGRVVRWFGTSTDIHERVLLEQSIAASEGKFRDIFETAYEGIWLIDEHARIEFANTRIAELLGVSTRDLIGHRQWEFVWPEDLPQHQRWFQQRRQGHKAIVELRLRHRDGRAVWLLMSAAPRFENGRFAGALDLFTDITEQKRTQAELTTTEARFQTFFELSATGNAIVDPQTGRFLHVNPRYCEITGYPAEQLVGGMRFIDLTHPDDRKAEEERFKRLHRGELPVVIAEKRYVRSDGTIVWVHLTSTILRQHDGQPHRQLSIVHDITARKVGEAELLEHRWQLQLAVETAGLGTFSYIHETHNEWSDRLKQLLGLPREATASLDLFFTRLHPDDLGRIKRQIFDCIEDESHTHLALDYRVVWDDRSVHYLRALLRRFTVVTSDGPRARLVGSVRDVTSELEFNTALQREVEQRTAALESKTRQLEEFCYSMAHDLRSPLRAIDGYAEILQHSLPEPIAPDAAGHLAKIRSSAQRLDSLIHDLVAFARVTEVALELQDVALAPLLDQAIKALHPDLRAPKSTFEVPSPLPIVRGEPGLLREVLTALISNALKFVASDTRPHIRIEALSASPGRARIEITDNGIGIAAPYQKRIFQVFERLRDAGSLPGTGMGLALARRAIERMGGEIGVRSEPGVGSTFWFELPLASS